MALDDPVTARIIAFIEGIGIPVIVEPCRGAELGREPYPAMTRWLR